MYTYIYLNIKGEVWCIVMIFKVISNISSLSICSLEPYLTFFVKECINTPLPSTTRLVKFCSIRNYTLSNKKIFICHCIKGFPLLLYYSICWLLSTLLIMVSSLGVSHPGLESVELCLIVLVQCCLVECYQSVKIGS